MSLGCFFLNMSSLPMIGLLAKTSGRSFSSVPMIMAVTMPSAMPIMEWLRAIAGTAMFKPCVKTGCDKPS